jgi:hypothetical protein
MTNGDKRRNRKRDKVSKRYKVRYDRLVAVILVLIVLIVILSSCVKSCSGKGKNKNSDTKATTTTADNTQQSSIIDKLESSNETNAILSGTADGQKPSESQYTTEIHKAADKHSKNRTECRCPYSGSQNNEPHIIHDHVHDRGNDPADHGQIRVVVVGQYVGETENWNQLPAGIYVVDGIKIVK